ncbi:MAG: hypothetical protein RR630_08490 [Coprobacillus sp.]
MARIWKWSIVIFLLCGLLLNREEDMMTALMDTPYQVLDLVMTVILSAALWGGFLKIIEKTGFMNYFSFLLKPILRLMYGKIIHEDDVYAYISSNVIANLLGLGSLATLSGIKAFVRLNELNPHPSRPSREMLTLIIVNTAGLCLFPSSIIMLRKQFGSASLYEFYPYMLLISITIIIIGLIVQRVIDHE